MTAWKLVTIIQTQPSSIVSVFQAEAGYLNILAVLYYYFTVISPKHKTGGYLMGELEDKIKKHWTNREEIISREYADVLQRCKEDLDRLDKETSYYPIVEIRESGTPGRFGEEGFNREWSITPRKWENESIEKLKAALQESRQQAAKYSTRVIQLQEIIARQNEDR
jgi:hypothetical protein